MILDEPQNGVYIIWRTVNVAHRIVSTYDKHSFGRSGVPIDEEIIVVSNNKLIPQP